MDSLCNSRTNLVMQASLPVLVLRFVVVHQSRIIPAFWYMIWATSICKVGDFLALSRRSVSLLPPSVLPCFCTPAAVVPVDETASAITGVAFTGAESAEAPSIASRSEQGLIPKLIGSLTDKR